MLFNIAPINMCLTVASIHSLSFTTIKWKGLMCVCVCNYIPNFRTKETKMLIFTKTYVYAHNCFKCCVVIEIAVVQKVTLVYSYTHVSSSLVDVLSYDTFSIGKSISEYNGDGNIFMLFIRFYLLNVSVVIVSLLWLFKSIFCFWKFLICIEL